MWGARRIGPCLPAMAGACGAVKGLHGFEKQTPAVRCAIDGDVVVVDCCCCGCYVRLLLLLLLLFLLRLLSFEVVIVVFVAVIVEV